MGKVLISASIVTYHNPKDEISSVIDGFLNSGLESLLFVLDNSNNRDLEDVCSNQKVTYIKNNFNLGFGTAHNIALREAMKLNSDIHFILNPDIKFNSEIIQTLVDRMKEESEIGAMMPKILNFDHSVQYLPKLLPSPSRLLIRLITPLRAIFKQKYRQYVLVNYEDVELNVPSLSGCFSLYNMKAIKKVGLFDERFFMYFEDNDLTRRIHRHYKTLYFPSVSILHGYGRGATKNFRLFRIYIQSAFTYFKTYGWFIDKERKQMNGRVIQEISKINNKED